MHSRLRSVPTIASLAVLFAAAGSVSGQGRKVGAFEGHIDVGAPKIAGRTLYNAVSQEYTLSAAGVNMWASARRVPVRLEADDRRLHPAGARRVPGHGSGPSPQGRVDRRHSEEADAAYVDGVVHGDGLTSLQYRRTAAR